VLYTDVLEAYLKFLSLSKKENLIIVVGNANLSKHITDERFHFHFIIISNSNSRMSLFRCQSFALSFASRLQSHKCGQSSPVINTNAVCADFQREIVLQLVSRTYWNPPWLRHKKDMWSVWSCS